MIIAGTFIYFLSTPPPNYLYPIQFSGLLCCCGAGGVGGLTLLVHRRKPLFYFMPGFHCSYSSTDVSPFACSMRFAITCMRELLCATMQRSNASLICACVAIGMPPLADAPSSGWLLVVILLSPCCFPSPLDTFLRLDDLDFLQCVFFLRSSSVCCSACARS
jgi:hypothetical protein